MMNKCSGCHEDFNSVGAFDAHFNSVGAFDAHRTGSYGDAIYAPGDTKRKKPVGYEKPTRRCMSSEEMVAKGMVKNARGRWTTGAMPEGIVSLKMHKK